MSTIGHEIGHAGTAPEAAVERRPSAERKIDTTLPRHLQKILALQDLEEPARRYEVSFRNVSGPDAARAAANLESDEEGTEVHLWVSGLPAREAVYEVLCDAEEWTATAGTFRTDATGKAYVVLTTALRKGEYNAIRIVRRGHRKDGTLVKRDVLTARLS